jgi:hypothetical protein
MRKGSVMRALSKQYPHSAFLPNPAFLAHPASALSRFPPSNPASGIGAKSRIPNPHSHLTSFAHSLMTVKAMSVHLPLR